MSVPKKFERLLESVSGSLGKLDELERTYNAARGNLTAELASYLNQLAAASAEANSQAMRAQIVRQLYWNEKVPAELLGEAFRLKTHTLIKVACCRGYFCIFRAQKPNPNQGIDPQAFETGLKRVLGVTVLPFNLPPTPFRVYVDDEATKPQELL